MGTFRSGETKLAFEVGESLSMLVDIAGANDDARRLRHRLDVLQVHDHGHNFGDNRKCRCGMTAIGYAMDGYKSLKPCPFARA